MTCGTYYIKNTITGKVYVGSSIKIERRWTDHKRHLRQNKHHSRKLQRSWNKHGSSCFLFCIYRPCLKDQLLVKEQEVLDKFDSYNNGYNSSKEAYHIVVSKAVRKKATQRAKLKLSEDALKQWADPKIRKKMVKAIRKVCATKEHKKKLSASLKNRKITTKWKKNIAKGRLKYLKKHPESKKAYGILMKRKFKNDPEFRKKHLDGVNRRWEDPKERKKTSDAAKKANIRIGKSQLISFNNITDTITGWSERTKINRSTLRHRLDRGLTLNEIFNPKLIKCGRKKCLIG